MEEKENHEMLDRVADIFKEYGYEEFIVALKKEDQAFLSPHTNDLSYILGTAGAILNTIFRIPEENLVKFYKENGIFNEDSDEETT